MLHLSGERKQKSAPKSPLKCDESSSATGYASEKPPQNNDFNAKSSKNGQKPRQAFADVALEGTPHASLVWKAVICGQKKRPHQPREPQNTHKRLTLSLKNIKTPQKLAKFQKFRTTHPSARTTLKQERRAVTIKKW